MGTPTMWTSQKDDVARTTAECPTCQQQTPAQTLCYGTMIGVAIHLLAPIMERASVNSY